jgi:type VI secretion system protein ImpG
VQVARARYQSSPFGSEITPPLEARDAEAALRIALRGGGGAPLTRLGISELRFFLSGDLATTNQLYELLFNHTLGVQVRVPSAPTGKGLFNLPGSCLRPVGFEEHEGMLPYGPRSFPGYRLLTEYFAFPQKFLFFEVAFEDRLAALPAEQDVEILLFLNRPGPQLENRVTADTFRLSCAPIVNLFPKLCEPIRFTRTKTHYLVLPDARRPQAMEIYSIDDVESIHPDTKETLRYHPFYDLHHHEGTQEPAYWHHRRQPSVVEGDSGTDVYLVMTNANFEPAVPATEVVLVRSTCTNRNLPADVQRTGSVDWQFQLSGQSPVRRITTPVDPTAAIRLDQRTSRWRLLSHLALNHLSITGGPDGAAALREILRLYDYVGSSTTNQQIDGVASVGSQRSIAPIRDGHTRGFCRGLDVTVIFDDDKYPGTGFFLLASVLERFIAQYASINSFTRLVARSKQREYWQKRWSPRTGNLTLA